MVSIKAYKSSFSGVKSMLREGIQPKAFPSQGKVSPEGADEVQPPELINSQAASHDPSKGLHLIRQARIDLVTLAKLVPRLTPSPARGRLLVTPLLSTSNPPRQKYDL